MDAFIYHLALSIVGLVYVSCLIGAAILVPYLIPSAS